jgi:hypothetical protein
MEIIKRTKEVVQRIIFVGFVMPDERKTCPVSWAPVSYKVSEMRLYENELKAVCKETNCEFVKLPAKFYKEGYEALLYDGIHPNSKGHNEIFKAVRKQLERK